MTNSALLSSALHLDYRALAVFHLLPNYRCVQLDQLGLSLPVSSTKARDYPPLEHRLLTVHIRAQDSIWSPVHSPHTAEMATRSLIKLIQVLNCAYKHNFVIAPHFPRARMAQVVENSDQKLASNILVRVGYRLEVLTELASPCSPHEICLLNHVGNHQ